jgi:hypothetical protein
MEQPKLKKTTPSQMKNLNPMMTTLMNLKFLTS